MPKSLTLIPNPNTKLQRMDGVVKSVLDCRKAYHNLTNRQFAKWYEAHFFVKQARVLAILAANQPSPGGIA